MLCFMSSICSLTTVDTAALYNSFVRYVDGVWLTAGLQQHTRRDSLLQADPGAGGGAALHAHDPAHPHQLHL